MGAFLLSIRDLSIIKRKLYILILIITTCFPTNQLLSKTKKTDPALSEKKKKLIELIRTRNSNLIYALKHYRKPVVKLSALKNKKAILFNKNNFLRRKEQYLSHFVHNNVNTMEIPSAIINIYLKNKPLVKIEEGLKPDSIISLGSLTKSFTAIAVMQLVEMRILHLDDPVKTYGLKIKKMNNELNDITIRHLMQHTSGIPYGKRAQKINAGIKFRYSNGNYKLLADLISLISGVEYYKFVETKILIPLEMKNSRISPLNIGSSGIRSCAKDLANYASMLLNGGTYKGKTILHKKSLQEMLQPPKFQKKTKYMYYYAHGFRVEAQNFKVISFYHAGLWDGCFAEVRIFPASKAFVVQLANPSSYKSRAIKEYRMKTTALASNYVKALSKNISFK